MHLTHTTPFLINTQYSTFENYLDKLSKSSYKNFKFCKKTNADLIWKAIPVDHSIINKFIKIWSSQKIKGNISGITGLQLDYQKLHCFAAFKNSEIIAIHLVELHDRYYDCQMPMYDKNLYSKRYLAKYMWFKLIEHSILNENIDFIDMWGGAYGKNWQDVMSNWEKYKKEYKFIFITEDIKNNFQNQLPYVIDFCKKCKIKILSNILNKINFCSHCR